jgi:hypothetical protein
VCAEALEEDLDADVLQLAFETLTDRGVTRREVELVHDA